MSDSPAHRLTDVACGSKVQRRDFEEAVRKELESYCVGEPTTEAIAFCDGAEWALSHFANGVSLD